MDELNKHSWFTDAIDAYLAGGLSGDERERFESHAKECESCAAELNAARELETKMTTLFAATMPAEDFEDRLIARIREAAPRLRINPAVKRAAIAAAALLFVGSVGYVANQQMSRGTLPGMAILDRVPDASNLRQLRQSLQSHRRDTNEYTGPTTQPGWATGLSSDEVFTLPSSNAEKWDFGGGANTALSWTNWNSAAGALSNLSYSYQNPYPEQNGAVAGVTLNTPAQMAGEVRAKIGNAKNDEEDGQNAANVDIELINKSLPALSGGQPLASGGRLRAGLSGAATGKTDVADRERRPATPNLATATNEPALSGGKIVSNRYVDGTETAANSSNYFALKDFALGTKLSEADAKEKGKITETEGRASLGVAKVGKLDDARANALKQDSDDLARKLARAQEQAAPQGQQQPQLPANVATARKVIRNGEIEFEVESFDNALLNITKITAEEGGFVATTNSEKLPNGKVKGTVVVRVAPDHLDVLVLKLRALGDLKRQNLTAQDITKQYTDLDSQLRAAKAMQERLLEMIKSGQGAIKDLLAAEKELGVWREKIEKIEGEMRYYDSQVALSTLSISAYEKDVKAAAAAKQSEQADIGVETEDVEKARADAIKAIDDAKGRIIESELKKFDAGQLAAKIVAEVSPDNAGAVIDRLKQLGKVARLEINRKQTTADGQTPPATARIERGDTRLVVSLYNIANIAPRQTTNLTIASSNVEEAYTKIVERVAKANGRIVTSNINRDKSQQSTAVVQFEVKTADAEPTLLDVKSAGEVMRLTMSENPDSNNVTSAKRGFSLQLISMDQVAPREISQRSVATEDVEKSYRSILNALAKLNARVLVSKLETPGNGAPASAYLDFEIGRGNSTEIEKVLTDAGDSFNRNVSVSPDTENTSFSKLQYKLAIQNVAALPAKQMTTLAVEVKDVDRAIGDISSSVTSVNGRIVDTTRSKEASGQTVARLMLDVPFKSAAEVTDKARGLGVVRVEQISGNSQAPDGALARARFAITVASPDVIVSSERGIWSTIRNGLSTSMVGLMWSLQLIVIGICLIAPWVLLIAGGWKLVRWSRRNMVAKATTPAT